MKKYIASIFLLLALATNLQAQGTTRVNVVYISSVPTVCATGRIYIHSTTGDIYTRKTGTGCVRASIVENYSAVINNNAAISVATATATTLTFNTELKDNNSFHSTASNTDRIVFVEAGLYAVQFSGCFAGTSGAGTLRQILVRLNDGATYIGNETKSPLGGSNQTCFNFTTGWQFAANDFITIQAVQNSGVSIDIVSTVAFSPYVKVWKVSN